MHFDCAGSHKVCVAVLGCGIFPVNFRVKCKVGLGKCLSAFRLRRLAQSVVASVVPWALAFFS